MFGYLVRIEENSTLNSKKNGKNLADLAMRVYLNAMLETVELPAGISNLDASLANVD